MAPVNALARVPVICSSIGSLTCRSLPVTARRFGGHYTKDHNYDPTYHVWYQHPKMPASAATPIKDMKSGEYYGYTHYTPGSDGPFIIGDFKYKIPYYTVWEDQAFYREEGWFHWFNYKSLLFVGVSFWAWVGYHILSETAMLTGDFSVRVPLPAVWTDEELGIPSDDVD